MPPQAAPYRILVIANKSRDLYFIRPKEPSAITPGRRPPSRVWRHQDGKEFAAGGWVPGFANHKYGRPFVVTVEARSTETHRREHFPEPGGRPVAHGAVRELRGAGEVSQSERDWAYARRALARGESPDRVRAAIAAFRIGQKADVDQYAERTVRKAMASLEADRMGESGREIEGTR